MFSRRWKYVPLKAPAPLTSNSQIRLPSIDLKMVTGPDAQVVDDIESQALALAEEIAAKSLPDRVNEYGDQLCRGFHITEGASSREWVYRWLRLGWAVGSVEESNGSARRSKSERHHVVVLNQLRGRMYGEVEQTEDEEVRGCADAYFLALFGSYFLRREPNATTDTIVRTWRLS